MDPIHVPPSPKSAFNKNRRVSDLIRKQVEHFQHIEYKLSPTVRQAIPQQRIVTEADAARYIAAITSVLLKQTPAAPAARPAPIAMPAPARPVPPQGLPMAAAADDTPAPAKPAKKAAPPRKDGKR